MKKVFLCLLILISVKVLHAQDNYDNNNNNDYESKGFKKENVFLGGSISLGFGSGNFGVGANPEIGYSLSQWLDGGVVFNLNYNSQRYYDAYSGADIGKVSSFNYGAGVFVRAYPVNFLFVQLQPEENWINYNTKDFSTNIHLKSKVNAASLIGGIGYSQRVVTQGSYFFMIGLDLLTNENSPYRDSYNHALPIIRGGFDVYLHPARKPKPVGPVL
ncbi:MAG TPA: hypothetical protein VEV62_08305 [Parafilimonas sp.]|nr:hypothetical protein [Parafilimonas sp.]